MIRDWDFDLTVKLKYVNICEIEVAKTCYNECKIFHLKNAYTQYYIYVYSYIYWIKSTFQILMKYFENTSKLFLLHLSFQR